MQKDDSKGQRVGFSQYYWKGLPVFPDSQEAKLMEASKRYCANMDNLRFLMRKPEPKPTRWQLAKERLVCAWNILKHGKEYYE